MPLVPKYLVSGKVTWWNDGEALDILVVAAAGGCGQDQLWREDYNHTGDDCDVWWWCWCWWQWRCWCKWSPLTEGGQTPTIEVGMTSVTMLSRRMGRRREEKKTPLTQVWMVGLRPTITVGPGFCYFGQHHPWKLLKIAVVARWIANHLFSFKIRLWIDFWDQRKGCKTLVQGAITKIVDNIHIYCPMNYYPVCKRVSLGLLARNYSSDLQLNPPGPVTPARQQVFEDFFGANKLL